MRGLWGRLSTRLVVSHLLVAVLGGLATALVVRMLAPTLFAGAHLSPTQAYSLSLLVFGLQRIASLLGAIWYAWSAVRKPAR